MQISDEPVWYERECRVDGVAVLQSLSDPVRLQDPPRPQDVLGRILWRVAPRPDEVHHHCLKCKWDARILFYKGPAIRDKYKNYTPQIAYRVAICPRGNLPYIQIYPIRNTIIFSTFLANFRGFLLKQHGMPYYAGYIADQPWLHLSGEHDLVI